MKTHEITTSKGEFVAVDLPTEVKTVQDSFCDAILTTHHDGYIETYYPYEDNQAGELKLICKLSEATEIQAKDIVDEDNEYGVTLYRNYATTSMAYYDEQLTALDSLHSLLKSKGIDINNGNWYLFNEEK